MNHVQLEQVSGPPITVVEHDGLITLAVNHSSVDIDRDDWPAVVDAVSHLLDDAPTLGKLHRHRIAGGS